MTEPPQDPDFGPYRLVRRIGRGGMGEVFLALDTVRGRHVALKRLNPELADDPDFQSRFRREARLVSRLNDPHVIPIHDFGDIDGHLYIDMRLVDGTDLATLLRTGPLDPVTALDVVSQIGSALDAAHAAGLVHRDVKPSNILLTPDVGGAGYFAYLVDFGIARALPGYGGSVFTATVGTGGTLHYMAPERIEGNAGDHRVDIYALTCVLFEALVGRPPYLGEPLAVLFAHTRNPPPLASSINPALPAAVDDVLLRGLAKQPQDRPPSANELTRAARAALATAPPAADRHNGASRSAASHQPPIATGAHTTPTAAKVSVPDGTFTRQRTLIEAEAVHPPVFRPRRPERPSDAPTEVGATPLPLSSPGSIASPRSARRRVVPAALAVTMLAGASLAAVLVVTAHGRRDRPASRPANYGTVYAIDDEGVVTPIRPDGRLGAAITLPKGDYTAAVAPAGTPNAGTVYLVSSDGSMQEIRPDGSMAPPVALAASATGPVIAGAGTPDAGTVYVPIVDDGTVREIRPDGRVAIDSLSVSESAIAVVAPAGTPNAGTVYVPDYGGRDLAVLTPDGTQDHIDLDTQSPGFAAVAPPGTPFAGRVYISEPTTVTYLDPDKSVGSWSDTDDPLLRQLVVAPAGNANAGYVYILDSRDDRVLVLLADGTPARKPVDCGLTPIDLAIAPAETPNTGTLFVTASTPTGGKLCTVTPEGAVTTAELASSPGAPVVGPTSAPNAGVVYLPVGSGAVQVIRPDGQATTLTIGPRTLRLAVAS